MAVLYIDLDGFKKVNDSLGHEAGDRVLCMIAEQLKTCMRPYDVLARMGGDEFTALLDTLDHAEDAARVAEKLLDLMTKTHSIDGVEVSLGASIGIASYPECGHSVDGLLRSADIAMYEAKRGGRQQYRFFSPEMNGRARSRLMLEESVRNAIDNNDFVLAYQPQVYLKNGKLRGFEALLRWEHNVAGKVSPNVFIPLLEETRLINRIGDWIFREGAMKLQSLTEIYGNGLLLSINLSPVQFGMPQLAERLRQIIDSYGLRPDQLEIEVTETALMHDIDYTRSQLAQLRSLGVRTAVDDFGTGYSSLAYLRHFELDTLKIDQLFIANMLDSPRDAAIVSTILELGRNLGLEVVAEGVETLEQREWLLEHGCEIMQGFLVSRPLNSDVTQHFPERVDWSSRRPDYPL
jgi:diguanylate cyclase (GGDEF)-like protein